MKKNALTGFLMASILCISMPIYAQETETMAPETETIVEETVEETYEEETESSGEITSRAATEVMFTYKISNGEVTITGLSDSVTSSKIQLVIPETIDGYPVTSIDNYAFRNNLNIVSLSLENADALNWIGTDAFYGCKNLTGTVTLPSSLTKMGYYTNGKGEFCGTLISKVVVEDGDVPLDISKYAFKECEALVSVELSGRVRSIGTGAFLDCPALEEVFWEAGDYAQVLGAYAFSGTDLAEFIAPDTLESIGEYAFENLTSLKHVEFNEGLKSIGARAFVNCTNLTGKLVIPSTVTKISPNNPSTNVFKNTAITEVVIEDGTEPLAIPSYTFSNCQYLHTVDLGNRVTSVGDYAFAEDIELQNLSWESSNWEQSIGYRSFVRTKLSSFEAPELLVSIGWGAFQEVKTLTSVTFNENLESISGGVFADCTSLTGTIILPESLSSMKNNSYYDGAFENTAITEVIVEDGNLKLAIEGIAFKGCSKLEKVTLPGRVYAIGSEAFMNTPALKTVIWEDGIYDQSIGSDAFMNSAITSFRCPKRLTTIGQSAFENCADLESIEINERLVSIGSDAFSKCKNLKGSIALPSTVTTIGSYAFGGSGISEISVADGLDKLTISYNAFQSCPNLVKVTLPGRTSSLSSDAFNHSPKIDALYINNIKSGVTFTELPSGRCDGYTFDGWYTSGGTKVTTTTEMYDQGISVVYPVRVAKIYTITLCPNGGTVSTRKFDVTYGEPYGTLPTPTRDGYIFDGWYVNDTKITKDTIVTTSWNHGLDAHWIDEDEIVSELPFKDVSPLKWYYNSVKWAYENGLLTGTSETTFEPNSPMTRGMLVTVLYRKEGRPIVQEANKFPDVNNNKYYASAITWASANNLVSGYTNGKFGPEDSITREQIAKILYLYADYKEFDTTNSADISSYKDAAKVSGYAKKYMEWAVAEGLIKGSNGELNPKGNATRAEISAILKRFVERYEMQ